eukprot:GHVP01005201.1.p1 GENE.GHVP01005201.1~~GHVP01005201.1.p1  ORF type:complete len:208 (+),score=29.87 GHVP01005201.1:698-1321(+)
MVTKYHLMGRALMGCRDVERFTIVDSPPDWIQIIDRIKPYKFWLRENHRDFEIYYFCWGTSVFRIKRQRHWMSNVDIQCPELKIYDPLFFREVLKKKNPSEALAWREWFNRKKEEDKPGKEYDIYQQAFLRHLLIDAAKHKKWEEYKSAYLKADNTNREQTAKSFGSCHTTTSEVSPSANSENFKAWNMWNGPNFVGLLPSLKKKLK